MRAQKKLRVRIKEEKEKVDMIIENCSMLMMNNYLS